MLRMSTKEVVRVESRSTLTPIEHALESLIKNKVLLVLTLVFANFSLMGCFGTFEGEFKNKNSPLGIISFELAGSEEAGREMVASWNEYQRQIVAFELGLDYLFMPLYSTAICYCCILTSRVCASGCLLSVGIGIGYSQYVAAVGKRSICEHISIVLYDEILIIFNFAYTN